MPRYIIYLFYFVLDMGSNPRGEEIRNVSSDKLKKVNETKKWKTINSTTRESVNFKTRRGHIPTRRVSLTKQSAVCQEDLRIHDVMSESK